CESSRKRLHFRGLFRPRRNPNGFHDVWVAGDPPPTTENASRSLEAMGRSQGVVKPRALNALTRHVGNGAYCC
ncbi:hypothetical protein ES332_A08G112400v1, partial [Gossypium tomentosum]